MIAAVEPGNFESLRAFLQGAGLPKAEVSELETAIRREPGVRFVEAGRETARWWTKISSGIKTGTILLARAVSEELLKQGIDVVDVEDVTLCISYCSEEKLSAHYKDINQLANSLAIEFGQESLSVVIDDTMYFFSPTPAYKKRYDAMSERWEADPQKKKVGFWKFLEEEI